MKSLLLGFLVLTSFNVFPGEKGGNGGGGHVCPDSVELYDFYEGKHPDLHNFNLWAPDSSLSTAQYVDHALTRLNENFSGIVPGTRSIIEEMLAIPYQQLVRPLRIPRIPDADIPFVNEDCDYQQIANWNERFGNVFFSKRLFEGLDSMNQAGLFVHEALYKAGRQLNNLENSNNVRKLVAKIFSHEIISSSDVQDVVGRDVLLAPKTGTCGLKVIYKCEDKNRAAQILLGENSFQSADGMFNVSCEELHSLKRLEISYSITDRIQCDMGLEINGIEYSGLKETHYEMSEIIFKSF